MEHKTWMLGDPLQHFGVLVGGTGIHDDMDRPVLRHPGIDDVEAADELLMTMTLHALAEDPPLAERGKLSCPDDPVDGGKDAIDSIVRH